MERVLFVFHNANYYSGATRSMTDIVVKLHKKIDATVLVPENEGSAKEVLHRWLDGNFTTLILLWHSLFLDYFQVGKMKNEDRK